MTEVILLSDTCYATNNMGSFAYNSDGVGCIHGTCVYG